MGARLVLAVGVGLTLSGCFLPTPVSMVSWGVDAVSFVATGKAVTDHGVSLAMGQDCALIRVFEGRICRKPKVYEPMLAGAPLQPLPDSVNQEQLAAAHPEVRDAILRAAQHDGWAADKIQIALLPGGFVADAFDSVLVEAPAGEEPEAPKPGTFGDLLSRISESLGGAGSEPYREPESRADGGPGLLASAPQERQGQQVATAAPQELGADRNRANREVGPRPRSLALGKLEFKESAALIDRARTLQNREIDG